MMHLPIMMMMTNIVFYIHVIINFTFIFCSLAFWNLNFLSYKPTAREETLVEMEQDLEHDNSLQKTFCERVVNVQQEKSNKCNLCDYASTRAGNLKTHLQRHSGEKTNKCNQCDYASSEASNLRTHLKTHSGEKSNKCNLCDFASIKASDLRRHLGICSFFLLPSLFWL